jgi:spermidine synthase
LNRVFAFGCSGTILLGAFLLFQVQPIISKMILPWFGGSPMVWTTCLLFFQTLLLAGYAYAHVLARSGTVFRQALFHVALVALALLLLPIVPGEAWKPADGSQPMLRILVLLGACVGLPYFLLAGTSPLVQTWFAQAYGQRSPYRLYALSNAGSLAALISYTVLVEPALATSAQGRLWSAAFAVYALLCAMILYKTRQVRLWVERPVVADASPPVAKYRPPTWPVRAAWLLLPTLASVLLMAVTDHLCQNVAVVPFLWIAPLTLYLLSFIICFERDAWYVRPLFAGGGVVAVMAASYFVLGSYQQGLWDELGYGAWWWYVTHSVLLETAIYSTLLFLLCMVCHGELVRLKPEPRRLTSFYLTVAAGGALGGLLVAVVCPLVFSSYLELNLAVVAGFLLAAGLLVVSAPRQWLRNTSRMMRGALGCLLVIIAAIVLWGQWAAWDREQGIVNERNFYGVVSVKERYPGDPGLWGLALYHGNTLHGYQHLAEAKRNLPTAYYAPGSGVGRALHVAGQSGPIRVGVVGLGVGTLAAYGRPGDTYRFYEIDPLVIRLAQQHFTFLQQCPAAWQIVPGDARLSLEREPDQQFDVLILDAFSGDTIPVHLLTSEAFAIYLRHVRPGGVIAAHVSSRYVDLIPVVMAQARRFNLPDVVIRTADEAPPSVAGANWMLLTRSVEFLKQEPVHSVAQVTAETDTLPVWTDQYSNLFGVLRRAGSAAE